MYLNKFLILTRYHERRKRNFQSGVLKMKSSKVLSLALTTLSLLISTPNLSYGMEGDFPPPPPPPGGDKGSPGKGSASKIGQNLRFMIENGLLIIGNQQCSQTDILNALMGNGIPNCAGMGENVDLLLQEENRPMIQEGDNKKQDTQKKIESLKQRGGKSLADTSDTKFQEKLKKQREKIIQKPSMEQEKKDVQHEEVELRLPSLVDDFTNEQHKDDNIQERHMPQFDSFEMNHEN
jgi:hypothetical protein